ncbi:MAG TPA: hypothetical protein VHN79_14305 [Lacunisphaera sp.]|nr:hypothetical protein [Lacunisphaera sp.]
MSGEGVDDATAGEREVGRDDAYLFRRRGVGGGDWIRMDEMHAALAV